MDQKQRQHINIKIFAQENCKIGVYLMRQEKDKQKLILKYLTPLQVKPSQFIFNSNLAEMGCTPLREKFAPKFKADLAELCVEYQKIILHIKTSKIFETHTLLLSDLVKTYLRNINKYDKTNMNLRAIDSVFKLHPYFYGTEITHKDGTTVITYQWLISSCLRHQKFVSDFPSQLLDSLHVQDLIRMYEEFLFICRHQPRKIIVPTKLEDFMWHSHMQDNEKYKTDVIRILGRKLYHKDDYSEKDIERFRKLTQEVRQELNLAKPITAKGAECGTGATGGVYPTDQQEGLEIQLNNSK